MDRTRRQMHLLPVGVGEPRSLAGTFARYWRGSWLPDGRVLVDAMVAGHDPRYYVQDTGGEPRPISPEGLFSHAVVSPDGRHVLTVLNDAGLMLDVNGGEPRPVAGFGSDDRPVAWSTDGRSVFVAHEESDLTETVYRMDLSSGARTRWHVMAPGDRAGITSVSNVQIGADEKSYAYSYARRLGELYLVDGLGSTNP
jgi:eukaryotic-like serine/threonine-protein kinase